MHWRDLQSNSGVHYITSLKRRMNITVKFVKWGIEPNAQWYNLAMLVEKAPLMVLVGTPHLVSTPLIRGRSLLWVKFQWSIAVHFPSFRIPCYNFRMPPLFLPILDLYLNSKWSVVMWYQAELICSRFSKKLGHPSYQTSADGTIDRVIWCPSWFGENSCHHFTKVKRDTLPNEIILMWSPLWVTVEDDKKFHSFLLENFLLSNHNLKI